ncbi:MAG TPA: manganese catalase family protein [Terriglobales bacterium]|nr:manganese catalase family protein [Terriglobales bacterium]
MFHHVKELQFNARVTQPDPKFAALLLEQFGGGNGELKAAMQYFIQAFSARQPYPDKYDLLMNIAVEEFSHLEIVGATIQMLLGPINGELKDAARTKQLEKAASESGLAKLVTGGRAGKEEFIHDALTNPQFLVVSQGGPTLTNSAGVPWTGAYVNANGDLTVDLRSDIGAEARAKIVYESLMQFTDDPLVKESLGFLMTREIAHMQMFAAALETIVPNFPPGILQGDPQFAHAFFNLSDSVSARGPWNQGKGPWQDGGEWTYVDNPIDYVRRTNGLTNVPGEAKRPPKNVEDTDKRLSEQRSQEVSRAVPQGENQWSAYPQRTLESPIKKAS